MAAAAATYQLPPVASLSCCTVHVFQSCCQWPCQRHIQKQKSELVQLLGLLGTYLLLLPHDAALRIRLQLLKGSVGQVCPLEHDSQLTHALPPLADGTTPAFRTNLAAV